jgi:hypothetical protein
MKMELMFSLCLGRGPGRGWVTAVLLASSIGLLHAQPTGSQWLLMSREGDCSEIQVLKRKIPDLGDVRDPDSFVKLMRAKGLQVTSNEISGPKGKAVEVKVPEKELFLLFVPAASCETITTRKRR